MTPREFLDDTTKLLEIQTRNGRTIKSIKIAVQFHPEGRTNAAMTWTVPPAHPDDVTDDKNHEESHRATTG